jgi:hypothetical protein
MAMYLSKQIELMAQKKKANKKSLVRKNYSCGIFQNYDQIDTDKSRVDRQNQ